MAMLAGKSLSAGVIHSQWQSSHVSVCLCHRFWRRSVECMHMLHAQQSCHRLCDSMHMHIQWYKTCAGMHGVYCIHALAVYLGDSADDNIS